MYNMSVLCVHVWEYTVFCPLWLLGHQYWEVGRVSRRVPTHHFTEKEMCVSLCICSCLCASEYFYCAVIYVCLILWFLQTFGHEIVRVRVGGSVWGILATFLPAYGPWVWDREGAGTKARPVLVGGGDVCVWGCDLDLMWQITHIWEATTRTNLLLCSMSMWFRRDKNMIAITQQVDAYVYAHCYNIPWLPGYNNNKGLKAEINYAFFKLNILFLCCTVQVKYSNKRLHVAM